MKNTLFLPLIFSLAVSTAAFAQAVPTATATAAATQAPNASAFGGATQNSGTLNYSLSASETIITGNTGFNGTGSSTNISGNAAYISSSLTHPTSFLYAGGYLFAGANGQPSSTFQNFGVSQVLLTKHWTFTATDFVSYLPTSPTTGLSGIAGVGDLGSVPVGPIIGQNVLTYYATRVSNNASASAEARLTGATSVLASGSYMIQRFLSNAGIDNSQVAGSIGPRHRIDERNTIGANYTYSRFTYGQSYLYPTGGFSFISQGVNLDYERSLSRKVFASISAGPQWTSSKQSVAAPSRLNFAANVSLNYTGQLSHVSANYSRGTDAGSGVLLGSTSDNLGVVLQRILSRNWTGSVSANYSRTSGILASNIAQTNTKTFYGGIQLSRRLGRDFSAYGSYTAQKQSINGLSASQNAFSGLSQIIGFGVTYAPKPIHFGHR
jgi:hypothetical protein